MYQFVSGFLNITDLNIDVEWQVCTPRGALNTFVYGDVSPIFLGIFFFLILIFLGQ